MGTLNDFQEIWLVDFEFSQPTGERSTPVCMVAREYRSSRLVRLWQDQLRSLSEPPFSLEKDNLLIAYYSSAEWGCHLALDWPIPARLLDMYVEFRLLTSGKPTPCGAGLLGALSYFGLDGIDATEKDTMRQLVMSGGP